MPCGDMERSGLEGGDGDDVGEDEYDDLRQTGVTAAQAKIDCLIEAVVVFFRDDSRSNKMC